MEHIYTDDELVEFRNQLRQYKDIGTKKVLSILRRLQLTKITIAQLQSTKISQTINSLSSITDFSDEAEGDQINELAVQIINKWKKLVEESKASRFKSTSDSTQKGTTTAATNNVSSNILGKKKPADPVLMKRQSSSGSVNTGNTNTDTTIENEQPTYSNEKKEALPTFKSDTRGLALNAISRMFDKVRTEMNVTQAQWIDLAVKLEQAIYDRGSLPATYKTNVKEVIGMFTSNEIIIEVVSKLLQGEVPVSDVAEAKSTVFLTEQKRAAIQKQQEEQLAVNDPEFYNNIRRQRLQNVEGEICKGCKKKTAFLVKELQTRSSDEPMTRFMECNNCGKSWRD